MEAEYFDDFAGYLTEVVRRLRDFWDITLRLVEPFNEPSAYWLTYGNNQEWCGFSAGQQRIVKELGKSLVAKGLFPTKRISVADENAVDQAVGGLAAYDDSAFSYMSQINTHTYYGRAQANFTNLSNLAAARNKVLRRSETGPLAGTGGQDIAIWIVLPRVKLTVTMKGYFDNHLPKQLFFHEVSRCTDGVSGKVGRR
ncbi:MAG: hypothetical protein JW699_06065 [Chitinispirillaceae bacterium]|nr:hypothetical protein [Chitinispirillaceae bacterium]